MMTPETPDDDLVRTRSHRPHALPQGFRAGLITAITVLLGFSLGFLRYWGPVSYTHLTLPTSDLV